jgi:DNA-binding CsgD family transcriptional regulator
LLDPFATNCEHVEVVPLPEGKHVEPGLTPRESEILEWVARGKTNPEIAEILLIAPTTVRRHLENVYAKLDVHTRTAAVTRHLGLLGSREREVITSVLAGLFFLPGAA